MTALTILVATLCAFTIGRISARRDHAPRVQFVSLSPSVSDGAPTCAERRRAARARRVLRHSVLARR